MSTLPPGSTHEKWMQRLPRRDFLRWGGALAAAAATPLALPRLVSAAPPLKAPGSLPFPTHAAGTPNLLPGMANIEHIVMVMMENHSFDAYLGMLPWRVPSRAGRVNGFQRLGADGRPLVFQTDAQNNVFRSFPATDPCQLDGYPHPQGPGNNQGWDGSHQSFNGGLMDGFARADGEAAMEYWDDQHLIPFYYDLARYFPVCDNYFSSTLAPTYPNRVFFFAASAGGLTATDTPPPASLSLPFGNIFTLLEENGVDWGGYYTNLPSPGLLGYTFAAQREAPAVSPIDHRSHLFGAGGDLNGTLALVEPRLQLSSVGLPGGLQPVTIIEEDFLYGTEEPPQNMLAGQYFVYRVLQLFMKYPNVWAKTMIILNYDEAGGFYDHVPPPLAPAPGDGHVAGDGEPAGSAPANLYGDRLYTRLGFRVPAIVISPFARGNFVSHTLYDHTSVITTIRAKWNLPALTYRDANANHMWDCMVTGSQPTFDPAGFGIQNFTAPPNSGPNGQAVLDSMDCTNNKARTAAEFPPAVSGPDAARGRGTAPGSGGSGPGGAANAGTPGTGTAPPGPIILASAAVTAATVAGLLQRRRIKSDATGDDPPA